MSIRILVVEDDREIRALMQASLSVEGFDVQTAVSLSEAFALVKHAHPANEPLTRSFAVSLEGRFPEPCRVLLTRSSPSRSRSWAGSSLT